MEPTWTIDAEAQSLADRVYREDLEPIDPSKFADGLLVPDEESSPLLPARELREIYADTLHDLYRLLEEVRFETALACMLLADFRVRRDRGEIQTPTPANPSIDMTISVEIIAVLAKYVLPPPPPSTVTHDMHQEMSGDRRLSRWLAAQLLDGAILRALSCVDRVATLLHLRANLPVQRRKDGALRLPGFNREVLRELRPTYEGHTEWSDFRAILDHPIYGLIKRFRDGNVHHRRWPSELHGEARVAYWDAGAPMSEQPSAAEVVYEGLSARQHVSLLLASWKEVLRPVVEIGSRLPGMPTTASTEVARSHESE